MRKLSLILIAILIFVIAGTQAQASVKEILVNVTETKNIDLFFAQVGNLNNFRFSKEVKRT